MNSSLKVLLPSCLTVTEDNIRQAGKCLTIVKFGQPDFDDKLCIKKKIFHNMVF